jgi:hypothetical protein
MTVQTARQIVQSVFELHDEKLGVKYVKLVQSPNGPYHILDVMFYTGLRVTVDLYSGDPVDKIGKELRDKVAMYRPSSVEPLSETISLIAECGHRAMSDHLGQLKLSQMNAKLMQELWEETSFSRLLRSAPALRRLEYEEAVELLRAFYPGTPALPPSSSDPPDL